MSHFLHPQILLLREGTDSSQGIPQIISNINACQAVVDIIKTTLGPRGMDKLIYSENDVTITNDGATIMSLLNITHPAANILCDISKSQDDQVGDGTTTVVILAGEFLNEAKNFLQDGLHPQIIQKGYKMASKLALQYLDELQIDLTSKTPEQKKTLLIKCAESVLNSKLLSGYKELFARMVVDAVCILDSDLDKSMIGIKKVTGGSCTDSFLVDGVAFKKTFSYAGFEQQPKKILNAKILLLNLELELKAEKENAEIRLEKPDDYQSIVDAEWTIIFEKMDIIIKSGANVVLSRLPIGDLATQYFADHGIFCAGRVEELDLKRTEKATGAKIQTTVNKLDVSVLGNCGEFEEMQIGSERYNIFRKCKETSSATIILRGGAHQFVEEAERSLNDAVMIVRRVLKSSFLVAGGGAIEMELSKRLRNYSRSVVGKEQIVINAFAKCLECIPRTLTHNAGYNSTDVLNKLRQIHASDKVENRWYGVNCFTGQLCNASDEFIWEASLVKRNALSSAAEAACLILSIDETIKCPSSNQNVTGGKTYTNYPQRGANNTMVKGRRPYSAVAGGHMGMAG